MRHVSGQFLEMELCFENEACLRAVLVLRIIFQNEACLRAVLVLRIIFSK